MPATQLAPPRHRPPTTTTLIDPEHDELILVREIARQRLGKSISPACQWRWVRKGVRGVRLESLNIMGCWYTTEAAWGAFISAQTITAFGADALPTPTERTAAKAERLRKAGLLK